MATSMTSPTHHFEQVSQLIESANSITDLNVIIKQLIPLSELKKILLDKLSTLKSQQHISKETGTDRLSIHSLYFNSYPFDEIFSNDIILSVIQFLSGSKMYHKLPQINTNFRKIMRENPVLYQQYKIQVTLSDNLWSNSTNTLFITISHQLQCIEISANLPQQFPYNAAIPLNSKIAPGQSRSHSPPQTNNFIIRSVQDMTAKCPFMWYAIRKWQIITHLPDYDHGDQADHSTLLSTPPFININNNTATPTQTPQIADISIPSLMEQLLHKSSSYIRSLQIDERIMSATPTGGVFGMYGLYTRGASSNFYLNYNHELNVNNKKKHIAHTILNNLMSLNNLIHIEWITDESAPILQSLYFNKCNNIVCLALRGSQAYTILNGDILANLRKLNVLSIEFDDLRYVHVNNNNDETKEEKEKEKIVVKFPMNMEFIEFKNYEHAGDVMLDLSHCFNIIAVQLTISSKKYNFPNMFDGIKWPIADVQNDSNYLIQCLLLQFSHKSMSPSHDVWNEYIQTLRNYHNNKRLPVKYIQCITNTYSQPIYYKMGNNLSINIKLIKGLGESNDNMNLSIKPQSDISDINTIRNNGDGDGTLWKTLIYGKYEAVKDGDIIAADKIAAYKKYFAMDIVKWIYHLGRDCGSWPSMDMFDTSSINNLPDISTRYIDTSTLSNNIIINPQYIQEQAPVSSASALFAVD